ncbi:MAG: methionyl-tRNA formyltransferase [Porticoccaceae bacterium]
MRIVFAGTPDFAARHLQSLIDDGRHQIVAVYTQPDRPAGRGKKLQASPVKRFAEEQGLAIYQPQTLRYTEQQAALAKLNADLMVVVAYGLILPQQVLDTPRLGCINVHGSILPKWRGAAPIQRAVEAGDSETGVTIMQMNAGLDTGPMLSITRCHISDEDTSGAIYERLADLGGPALLRAIDKLETGSAQAVAQDDGLSSYASKIDKAEAQIDWSEAAMVIDRRIRAFNPFPCAFTSLEGQRIKIWSSKVERSDCIGQPGQIVRADNQGLLIRCGQGSLLLTEIQLAGKSRLAVAEILKSRADLLAVGRQLGL